MQIKKHAKFLAVSISIVSLFTGAAALADEAADKAKEAAEKAKDIAADQAKKAALREAAKRAAEAALKGAGKAAGTAVNAVWPKTVNAPGPGDTIYKPNGGVAVPGKQK